MDCPGCGFQRALHASLHAHFVEAIHFNLFLLVAIPITILWCFNGILIEKSPKQSIKKHLLHLNKTLIYFYIFCYICWFIIRNLFKL
ncbi:MAG: DUF2752 domain-containing protein [Prevotella sp.]|nr:DUF2752 domain-containing protein [Prevotella sp.]